MFALVGMNLQDIQEDGDHSCIDEIHEHGTNDGYYEKWFDGISVFITYGTPVCHGIWYCTKAEATYARTQDSGIIIAP